MNDPKVLAQPCRRLELAAEASRLRSEPTWDERGHNAVTLAKYDQLRVVLMVMKQGARMQKHTASGQVLIQALTGRAVVHVGGQAVEIGSHMAVTIEREIEHDVEALEACELLLMVTWPPARSAT